VALAPKCRLRLLPATARCSLLPSLSQILTEVFATDPTNALMDAFTYPNASLLFEPVAPSSTALQAAVLLGSTPRNQVGRSLQPLLAAQCAPLTLALLCLQCMLEDELDRIRGSLFLACMHCIVVMLK
jgi:hypothetical protein